MCGRVGAKNAAGADGTADGRPEGRLRGAVLSTATDGDVPVIAADDA